MMPINTPNAPIAMAGWRPAAPLPGPVLLPRLVLPLRPKARWPVGWWYWTAPPAGQDLRLGEGRNFLGVDAAGNPAVLDANSPLAVRRGIVVYDPQDNNWCALPGSSNELCTLNGKSLVEKMPLTAGVPLLWAAHSCVLCRCVGRSSIGMQRRKRGSDSLGQ